MIAAFSLDMGLARASADIDLSVKPDAPVPNDGSAQIGIYWRISGWRSGPDYYTVKIFEPTQWPGGTPISFETSMGGTDLPDIDSLSPSTYVYNPENTQDLLTGTPHEWPDPSEPYWHKWAVPHGAETGTWTVQLQAYTDEGTLDDLAITLFLVEQAVEPTPTTTPTPPPQPNAPTNLVARWDRCEDCCTDLSWNDNSDNEDGFRIERRTGSESDWSVLATVGVNVTSYDDCIDPECTPYHYRVQAFNAYGVSAYSNEAVVRPCGGCFIASAAYGSYLDSRVESLRYFRDSYLADDPAGSSLLSAYYAVSPPIAQLIDDHPALKPVVRIALLPAVATSQIAVGPTLAVKAAVTSLMVLLSAVALVRLGRRMPQA